MLLYHKSAVVEYRYVMLNPDLSLTPSKFHLQDYLQLQVVNS